MANDKFLTVDKISKISDLVNVKRVSDLEYPSGILDGTDSTFLNNTYLLTSTYIDNYNKYINYKLKLNEITKYLQDAGSAELIKFRKEFELFISNLIANTQDSFIRFEATPDNGNPNNEYSYIITPQYSEINDNPNPFNDSTYAYTDMLTNGIITADVLEEYVRNTLGRVLGVPSTPAYISEAIDSVIEFVDWFKGFVKDDTSYGSLQNLINTIETKDLTIKSLSYDYTDSVAENIKNLAYDYTDNVAENIKNLSYDYIDLRLEDVDANLIPGNNISIGEDNSINCYIGVDSSNNSLVINGTQYSLTLNANGKLGFEQYTPMSLTSSGGGNLEIDSTAESSNLTFKCTANNDIVTATWSGGSETVSTSGKTTQITVTQDGNNTITRTCSATDNTGHGDSKTIKLQFTGKRYFLGWSTNPNLEFISCNNGTNITSTNNYTNFKDSLSTSDIYKKGFTGNGFWYMIWPTTVSISSIFFGSGTQKAPAPGGWHEHVLNWQEGDPITNSNHITVNQYSTTVKYHVYRSDNSFSGQMNIQF